MLKPVQNKHEKKHFKTAVFKHRFLIKSEFSSKSA